MKKILAITISTVIFLVSITAVLAQYAANTWQATGPVSKWPDDIKIAMYIYNVSRKNYISRDDLFYPGAVLDVTPDDTIILYVSDGAENGNLNTDLPDYIRCSLTVTDKNGNQKRGYTMESDFYYAANKSKGQTPDEDYANAVASGAKTLGEDWNNSIIIYANDLYGTCTAKVEYMRKDLTTEAYEYTINVEENYVTVLPGQVVFEEYGNRDAVVLKELNGFLYFADETLKSHISIKSESGAECYSGEIYGQDGGGIGSHTGGYNDLIIYFDRNGLETHYTLTIPKGLLLFEDGMNEEYTVEFETPSQPALEGELFAESAPDTTIELDMLEQNVEVLFEFQKGLTFEQDMKITLDGQPVDYKIKDNKNADETTLSVTIKAKGNNNYRLFFEDNKITTLSGGKNKNLSFGFKTVFKASKIKVDKVKNNDPMYTFGTYMYSSDYVGEHIHFITLTAGKDGLAKDSDIKFVTLSKADDTPKYAKIIKLDTDLEPYESVTNKVTFSKDEVEKIGEYYAVVTIDDKVIAAEKNHFKINTSVTEKWEDYAEDGFDGGSGTKTDPYIIKTAEQLAYLAKQVNEGRTFENEYIEVKSNIDLDGKLWVPIGYAYDIGYNNFCGNLEGNGNYIKSMLVYNAANETYSSGLFGTLCGNITNVYLTDVKVMGKNNVGGLVGVNHGNIEGCLVEGMILGTRYIGGVAGSNYGRLKNSAANCTVDGWNDVGGLVGNILDLGIIEGCSVSGYIAGETSVGGLVGSINGGQYIKNCFGDTTAASYTADTAGGIVGEICSDIVFEDIQGVVVDKGGNKSSKFVGKIKENGNKAKYINCIWQEEMN